MRPKFLISVQLIIFGLSALSVLPEQAIARTIDLGSQTAPTSISYGNTFSVSQNQFSDDYTFSILAASVNSITSTISLAGFLGINNLQSRLYGNPNGLLRAQSTAIPLFQAGLNGTIAAFEPVTLESGNYILEISGEVVGTSGGSYGGVLNIAPVPEPEEWLMLLAGLGVAGLIMGCRNRRQGMRY